MTNCSNSICLKFPIEVIIKTLNFLFTKITRLKSRPICLVKDFFYQRILFVGQPKVELHNVNLKLPASLKCYPTVKCIQPWFDPRIGFFDRKNSLQ